MMNTFSLYLYSFLNPMQKIENEKRISYFELMGVSWSLHILYALYSVISIYLGLLTYEYVSQSQNFTHIVLNNFSSSLQKFNIFNLLFQVILYPFIFQFGYKFLAYVLKFFGDIFNIKKDENFDDSVDELLSSVFSANILLAFPVIGSLLSLIVQAYYLFIGARAKLGFSKMQALLVLMTPLFLTFLMTMLVVAYITFIVSLLS